MREESRVEAQSEAVRLRAIDPALKCYAHQSVSHDDLSDGYERVTRFHLPQFAELAKKLDAMPQGDEDGREYKLVATHGEKFYRDQTVLDNCCLLFLSNMWAGRKHDNMKLPVVTAGGLGGAMKTERSLNYLRTSTTGTCTGRRTEHRRTPTSHRAASRRCGHLPIDCKQDATQAGRHHVVLSKWRLLDSVSQRIPGWLLSAIAGVRTRN